MRPECYSVQNGTDYYCVARRSIYRWLTLEEGIVVVVIVVVVVVVAESSFFDLQKKVLPSDGYTKFNTCEEWGGEMRPDMICIVLGHLSLEGVSGRCGGLGGACGGRG